MISSESYSSIDIVYLNQNLKKFFVFKLIKSQMKIVQTLLGQPVNYILFNA